MISHDPYRTTSSTVDEHTWSQGTWSRVQWLAAPAIMTACMITFASMVFAPWSGWFVWPFVALCVWGLLSTVRETLRSAHRVILRRDGTLELVRPIGTARIRLDRVRAMRVSRFQNEGSYGTPIRLLTDDGTYHVTRGLEDLDGMVEVLRERHPRMELPGIS